MKTPQKVRKVNLFLIGCMRSGTTSLFNKLTEHPQIYTPAVKEIHHFNDPLPAALYRPDPLHSLASVLEESSGSWFHAMQLRDPEAYQELFGAWGQQRWALDASPFYFHEPGVLDKLHSYNPDARILLLYRDPIDRILSHYLMDLGLGQHRPALDALLEHELELAQLGQLPWDSYIFLSCMEPMLSQWQERFGDQLLVIHLEELTKNPKDQLHRICQHLGLDPFANDVLPHRNQSRMVRSRRLSRWLQNFPGRQLFRKMLPVRQRHGVARLISHDDRSKVRLSADVRKQLQDFFSSSGGLG